MKMFPDKRIERYYNDASFNAVVKQIENFIYNHDFTPQEIRDAVFVAAFIHAQDNSMHEWLYDYVKEKDEKK